MKIAGIVLMLAQAVTIVAVIASGSLPDLIQMITGPKGIFDLIGFFLPAIIGAVLLIVAKAKSKQ